MNITRLLSDPVDAASRATIRTVARLVLAESGATAQRPRLWQEWATGGGCGAKSKRH